MLIRAGGSYLKIIRRFSSCRFIFYLLICIQTSLPPALFEYSVPHYLDAWNLIPSFCISLFVGMVFSYVCLLFDIWCRSLQISLEKQADWHVRTLGFWSFKVDFGAISFEYSSPAAISYGNNRSGSYIQLFSSQHSRVTASRGLQQNIWLKQWIEMHSQLIDSLWCQTNSVLLSPNQELKKYFKLFTETTRGRNTKFWRTRP